MKKQGKCIIIWDDPLKEGNFLGTKKDYFSLYRHAAKAILELEKQYNLDIPIGGPAVGFWFENFETNTNITPERSLIYDLLRFCSQNSLPIDFVSWKVFSTEVDLESKIVAYNRNLSELIKEWRTAATARPG